MDKKRKPTYQFELSKLTNSSESSIKDKSLSEGFKNGGKYGTTEHFDTVSKQPIPNPTDVFKANAEKAIKMKALRQIGGKVLSALPFAGVGYAALQGDPAMAAEEAMGDVPVLGQAYEALKPDTAGNRDEERTMLAEHDARVNYDKSPARLARMNALRTMGR